MKKLVPILLMMISVVCICTSCGNKNLNTEENSQVTESEEEIEIIDAADILLTVWAQFDEINLDVMGGHYSNPAMGAPSKYDLSQSTDLVQMYCVPESQLMIIDDAATVIDLYNAARFTASAFHLTDATSQKVFVEEMKKQIAENTWHGEVPEKLFVVGIQEDYVVAVYGREELVDVFEKVLVKTYIKQ